MIPVLCDCSSMCVKCVPAHLACKHYSCSSSQGNTPPETPEFKELKKKVKILEMRLKAMGGLFKLLSLATITNDLNGLEEFTETVDKIPFDGV